MTYVVWIAIGLAAVVFCIFAGWPLYNTYKTRGLGADVAEGQAYLKAKARAEAKAAEQPEQARPGTAPGSGRPGARGRPARRVPPASRAPRLTCGTAQLR